MATRQRPLPDARICGAGFAGDQEVLSPPDPVAGRELGEQRLVETARRFGVEILDGGSLPELRAERFRGG
jgi:hypothetical protein